MAAGARTASFAPSGVGAASISPVANCGFALQVALGDAAGLKHLRRTHFI